MSLITFATIPEQKKIMALLTSHERSDEIYHKFIPDIQTVGIEGSHLSLFHTLLYARTQEGRFKAIEDAYSRAKEAVLSSGPTPTLHPDNHSLEKLERSPVAPEPLGPDTQTCTEFKTKL